MSALQPYLERFSLSRRAGPFARRAAYALAAVVLLADVLVWLAGEAPLTAVAHAAAGTWGTWYGVGQVVFKATPLLFAGVAFDVARRAGLFNIGVEGQLMVASLVAGTVGGALPRGAHAVWVIPLLLCVAALSGGAWSAVAGAFRTGAGPYEVIATIMLNRIAELLVPFALAHGAGATTFRTADIPPGAHFARLERFFPAFHGSAANLAIAFAIGVAFLVAAWQRRAALGRQLGWVGLNAQACEAAGIAVRPRILFAMALSGAVAGLGASATVLGYRGYYETGLGAGAGFTGIAVALLGRGTAVGMCGAALLVGTLQQAGLVLNASVPKEVSDVLAGACILAIAVASRRR